MNIPNVPAGINQTMPPMTRPQLYVNIKGNIVPLNENFLVYNNNQPTNVNENMDVIKEDEELTAKFVEKDGNDNTARINEEEHKIPFPHTLTRQVFYSVEVKEMFLEKS